MTPDLPAVAIEIVELTNRFRAGEGLPAVARNSLLDAAAASYAAYLARTAKFAHDADGRQPSERVEAAGYGYCKVAENLAMALDSRGFSTPALAREAVEGWINSPGHRRNLLETGVTDIGVAVAKVPDRHPKFVTVQLFGRPQSLMMSFQVSNSSAATVTYEVAGERHDIEPGHAIRHQTCEASDIVFAPGQGKQGPKPAAVAARYPAADGRVYVLTSDAKGGLKIAVEERRVLGR
ncbi:MAG: CAP domain-containing protein [Hyphomicrobiaceae bacterium]|nr:CAP domain-containing protein [Hyphomicrobiaceae bacterium]